MFVRQFSVADAPFIRSPGQDGDAFVGNVIDHLDGAPITVGFGRYGPNQSMDEEIEVHDVMIVLEGRVSISSDHGTVTAGPGEIIHMPPGVSVNIRSHDEGAVTAYVTYPHWEQPEG
jgi:ethanolamine utilization protein EutQ (cupin superfamily)